MEDKSKTLEILKQYSIKNKNKSSENRDEVTAILKDVIDHPTKYTEGSEADTVIDTAINNELIRIFGELKEKNLVETEKTIDEILKPNIH